MGIVEDPVDWVTATLLALTNKRAVAVECLLPYWPPAQELPLYPAVHIGFPDGVRLLLARGADYHSVDVYGEGILHWIAGSGLEMLRLFKGIGVSGVNVGMTDNKGKTAVEIMEERWDLTEEFRREFMELLDGLQDAVVEDLGDVEDGDSEVDEDVSEDIFYDAEDDSPLDTLDVPEQQQGPPSSGRESPTSEPDGTQSSDGYISDIEPQAPSTVAPPQDPTDHDLSRDRSHDDENLLQYELNASKAPESAFMATATGAGTDHLVVDEVIRDKESEQKYPGSPRTADHSADKVLTEELGLKFIGTSAAFRGQ